MIKKVRRALAAWVAVGALATATACGASGGSEASEEDFQILAIYPLSGPLAPYGQAAAAGVKAAAELANSQGGIGGREVKVTTIDDAYDASKAVTGLQDYLSKNPKPDMLIPGLSSQEILAVLPIATQHKIFTTSTAATAEANNPEEFPYAFHVLVDSDRISQFFVDHFTEEQYQKIAFIGPDNASGRAGMESMEKVAQEANLDFAGELLDPTATDAAPTLLKLQDSNPDVLVLEGLGPTAGVFLSARSKLDWDIPAIGTPNFASNNLSAMSKASDWENLDLMAWSWAVAGTEVTDSERFKSYRESLGAEELQLGHPAYGFGYNMVIVAWAGYEGAGSTDVEKVVSALSEGNTPAEIRELSLGPAEFGYSATNRFQIYQASDISIVPAGPIQDGLIVPGS